MEDDRIGGGRHHKVNGSGAGEGQGGRIGFDRDGIMQRPGGTRQIAWHLGSGGLRRGSGRSTAQQRQGGKRN